MFYRYDLWAFWHLKTVNSQFRGEMGISMSSSETK